MGADLRRIAGPKKAFDAGYLFFDLDLIDPGRILKTEEGSPYRILLQFIKAP
ncbi:MAG: hypothetical protein P8010_22155 [Desulfosarcinaceae bacterium]